MVTGAVHVYNLNQLTVLALDRYIWSPCCCFLSLPIFKVPAQLYLVIFYNRSLLRFQLVPAVAFLHQSLVHLSITTIIIIVKKLIIIISFSVNQVCLWMCYHISRFYTYSQFSVAWERLLYTVNVYFNMATISVRRNLLLYISLNYFCLQAALKSLFTCLSANKHRYFIYCSLAFAS